MIVLAAMPLDITHSRRVHNDRPATRALLPALPAGLCLSKGYRGGRRQAIP